MDIVGAFNMLKEEFSEAITINSLAQIKQNGLYLYFDGIQNVSAGLDIASFAIVVAANSLNADSSSALSLIADVRKRLFLLGAKYAKNYFKAIKAAQFEGSTLFLYAALAEIELRIDNDDDE